MLFCTGNALEAGNDGMIDHITFRAQEDLPALAALPAHPAAPPDSWRACQPPRTAVSALAFDVRGIPPPVFGFGFFRSDFHLRDRGFCRMRLRPGPLHFCVLSRCVSTHKTRTLPVTNACWAVSHVGRSSTEP